MVDIPNPNGASDACLRAASLVAGQRDRVHGSKAKNFANIANLWTGYLSIRPDPSAPLNTTDVANLMVLLKVARTQHGSQNLDDWDDMIGYAACGAQLSQEE